MFVFTKECLSLKGIANYFEFDRLHTNFKREIIAGCTTFVSMAYILFVNPTILGASGMNQGAVFTATALSAAFACLVMGLYAKYPFASAPSLGINAFFAYSVCIEMHIPWQTALAGVFVASIIFLLLTVLKLRETIINSIPVDLKYAISSGIGLFIAFVGLKDGGLIVADKSTLVALGDIKGVVWVTLFGLLVTVILMLLNVPGAIFIGMVAGAVFGMFSGYISMPKSFISSIPSLEPTFGVALRNIGHINTMQMWIVVFTFLLVTFFDTTGTLIGLAQQGGFMKDNKMPRVGKALMADSTGMMVGSVLGTSPVSAYIESSAGIAVGGRSGFTVVITGLLFIVGMFFSPLLAVATSQVTAPALIIVGVLMAQNTAKINWSKLEIAIPAFLILIGMPLTYSIADGLALGFVAYPITMIAAKKWKDVPLLMYVLFFVFIAYFAILGFK
ncbi:NCS2 family permease [Ligilactobacillus cholophilus]|uniref:NCS2 family permease n=1 Tax=Ligilactobacillus cholophilus TaxID=3050131 RepID=UPI0025AF6D86|nr:NCS2 family permease [Ligilactobacillus cholophilus]